ncbi:transposable element Tcb1 transposase [Trichonephila clavipes]|nr:transposable element Tcb1 transposase [Trichonephila clavipes]
MLQIFVDCLEEITLFLQNESKIEQFPQLMDGMGLLKLMFFTDIRQHFNELNVRLQGTNKTVIIMMDLILAFEIELYVFKNDTSTRNYEYFPSHTLVTHELQRRYLAATAKRNRWSTASELSRQLSSAIGTSVSRYTVYRRLGHIGVYARSPVRCVQLTATHCRLRLTWSREHVLWTQQWSCVMFSDDSRFSLTSDSRWTLIWRAPGTRYHQENTIERHRYGGAGWLV